MEYRRFWSLFLRKAGYNITQSSPAKNAGITIPGNISKDYYGNKIEKGAALNICIDNGSVKDRYKW